MHEEKPASRDERLKAALRANLRRRKAQERGRATPEKPDAARDDGTQDHDAPVAFAANGPDSDKSSL